MDDYKYQQRRKVRGDHCIGHFQRQDGTWSEIHCSCGCRVPPGKKHKDRIVKRALKDQLRKEVEDIL